MHRCYCAVVLIMVHLVPAQEQHKNDKKEKEETFHGQMKDLMKFLFFFLEPGVFNVFNKNTERTEVLSYHFILLFNTNVCTKLFALFCLIMLNLINKSEAPGIHLCFGLQN